MGYILSIVPMNTTEIYEIQNCSTIKWEKYRMKTESETFIAQCM